MIAAAGPSALWYLTRGAGAVALLLLTASVVLGAIHADRRRPGGAPRLLVESAHRTISLLVLAVLAVHILTSVLDAFAPIRLVDAVVPFASTYRPLWVGFGALALDLLVALALTSALRARLGQRSWRAVHWLAYACWPLAVVHGLGTGSDARTTWMLGLTLGCVVAVLVAIAARLASTGPGHRAVRSGALAATALAAMALAIWLPQGPLAHGWASRSGTPAALLASAKISRSAAVAPARRAAAPPRAHGFSAPVTGVERDGQAADGSTVIDIALDLPTPRDSLRVRLGGQALEDGGVAMRTSAVTLVHGGVTYQGRISSLDGTILHSLVGSPDGRALRLTLSLELGGPTVRGQLTARPVSGAGR